MYLTKKHLSRRTLLRGAGVSVGLPLLDAMIPAATAVAKTAAAPKLRAGFFYIPHGAIMWNTAHGKAMDRWTPSGAGADFKLSPILEPLEKHKHAVTSFSNPENKASVASVHKYNPATWLSGVKPDLKAPGPSMSATIDQIIAGRIGQETALPSLEVCSESETQAVACEAGFGCLYSSTLSYRDAHSPLPMESNPRKVFAQLFGEGATAEERVAIVRPIMWIGLNSWSRFSAITWSGSRSSWRSSPPRPTAKARCWITPCCSTAPTCPTATCTVIIRCRLSWSAAAPARSPRGDGRSS